ncbi:MAG TPA: class I SAM-dependent methyltransferase [Halomicronema sp.]
MQRILEPEVMDTWQEAIEYDAMDFTEVNRAFAESVIKLAPPAPATILDAGTGTARIPIFIAQMRPHWQLTCIDLSQNMLKVAKENIKQANLESQINLQLVDAKKMPYPDAHFDLIISNSIIHHLHDPLPFFYEIKRVLKPNGGIFIRDLLRPASPQIVDTLVNQYTNNCNTHQKQLFRDSLHAAFTLPEIHLMIEKTQLQPINIYQSSDRHWTAERTTI